MNQLIFIGNCSELIAVSSDNGKPLRGKKQSRLNVIPGGCLVIKDGLIQDFGRENDLKQLYSDFSYFDAQRATIMPAFVDPHTHIVFSGSREEEFINRLRGESYLGNLEKGYGIHSTVKKTQEATVDALYNKALERIKEFQRHGTVGLEIKSGYGLNLETEKKILLVINQLKNNLSIPIGRTFLAAHALPLNYKGKENQYIDLICTKMIPEITECKLADFIDVFCEKGVFSPEESRLILSEGVKAGLKAKIHTDEFYSIGGLQIASDLDAISADHLIVSKKKELEELAKKNTIAVILPGTSFAMKINDYLYGRRIIDMNIPLAIGTDFNPGTCMCCSMQMMMELSVLKFGLTIEEAINASTINASFACGLEMETGSIEKGKRADLVFFNIDSYKKLPYCWGYNKVISIFKKGEPLIFA